MVWFVQTNKTNLLEGSKGLRSLEILDAVVEEAEPLKGMVKVTDNKYIREHYVPYIKFFYAKQKGFEIVPKTGSLGLLIITNEKKIFVPAQATILNNSNKNASLYPLSEGDVALINDSSLFKISENEFLIKYKDGMQIFYDNENNLFVLKSNSMTLYDNSMFYSTNYDTEMQRASPEILFKDSVENEKAVFSIRLFNLDVLLNIFFDYQQSTLINMSITDKKEMFIALLGLNLNIDDSHLSLTFGDISINVEDFARLDIPDSRIYSKNVEINAKNNSIKINENGINLSSGDNNVAINNSGITLDGSTLNINTNEVNINGNSLSVYTNSNVFDSQTTRIKGVTEIDKGKENSLDIINQKELEEAIKKLETKLDTLKNIYNSHFHNVTTSLGIVPSAPTSVKA